MKEELRREAAELTKHMEKIYHSIEEQHSQLEELERKARVVGGRSTRLRKKLHQTIEAIKKDSRNSTIVILLLVVFFLFLYLI